MHLSNPDEATSAIFVGVNLLSFCCCVLLTSILLKEQLAEASHHIIMFSNTSDRSGSKLTRSFFKVNNGKNLQRGRIRRVARSWMIFEQRIKNRQNHNCGSMTTSSAYSKILSTASSMLKIIFMFYMNVDRDLNPPRATGRFPVV